MAKASSRRLILHVGQTKAGSTAIQNYLDSQRTALRDVGILFPRSGFEYANPFDPKRTAGHLRLVRAITRSLIDAATDAEGLREADTVILSAENLFLDREDEELSALASFFSEHAVTLVLVARSAAAWLEARYIEDVMSGFHSSVQTFDAFCVDMVERGALDYAARLDHLVALLGAFDVKVINYDAATDGAELITSFLSVTCLPVTDPQLALTLRANIREKEAFLIEGKRRINHCIGALRRTERLDLEARIRAQVPSIVAGFLPERPRRWKSPTCLSPETCRQIAKSNRRLVRDYGLNQPLPDPDPDSDPTPGLAGLLQHRMALPGIDVLTLFGLQTAAALCQETAAAAAVESAAVEGSGRRARRYTPDNLLAEPGIAAAIDVLAGCTVSLHLDSPETALWAACMTGRLPVLLTTEATPLAVSDELGALKLPSDVLCIDAPPAPAQGSASIQLPALVDLLRGRPPQVVFAPGSTPPETLGLLGPLLGPETVLVLTGVTAAYAAAVADKLDLVVKSRESRIILLAKAANAAPVHAPVFEPMLDACPPPANWSLAP